ncbi:hypothetical protein [Burkholderia gladioli]|uniref:hypothetical protein n=1 Tax=Burkholderia gladioli TaxID=28095 RepID=UPI0016401C6A|nr:hypothetical protein [Burkholderia gladioli]MBJ9676587.1 hypothetical protein [Burkholderia gladioli]MDN7462947.1 hypothetical protein [Burkholderia gladioli]
MPIRYSGFGVIPPFFAVFLVGRSCALASAFPSWVRADVREAVAGMCADHWPDGGDFAAARPIKCFSQVGRHFDQQAHAAAVDCLAWVKRNSVVGHVLPVEREKIADTLSGLVRRVDQAEDRPCGRCLVAGTGNDCRPYCVQLVVHDVAIPLLFPGRSDLARGIAVAKPTPNSMHEDQRQQCLVFIAAARLVVEMFVQKPSNVGRPDVLD